MVNYWLFSVVDAKVGNSRIEALDLLGLRMKRLYWLLNSKSPHFRKVKKDDKIIFYVGGKDGRVFAGSGIISTNPRRLLPEIKRFVIEDPEDRFNYTVNLREIELFEKARSTIPLLKSLSFVKDERNWGRYFQGSIIKIGESDYRTITQSA